MCLNTGDGADGFRWRSKVGIIFQEIWELLLAKRNHAWDESPLRESYKIGCSFRFSLHWWILEISSLNWTTYRVYRAAMPYELGTSGPDRHCPTVSRWPFPFRRPLLQERGEELCADPIVVLPRRSGELRGRGYVKDARRARDRHQKPDQRPGYVPGRMRTMLACGMPGSPRRP